MARTGSKLLLLLWKNFKIQIRHPIATVVEIVLPIVFVGALVSLRAITSTTEYEAKTYDPFPPWPVIDSSGEELPTFKLAWSPENSDFPQFTSEAKKLMDILEQQSSEHITPVCFENAQALEGELTRSGATNISRSAHYQTLSALLRNKDGKGGYLAGVVLEDIENPNNPTICSSGLRATIRFPGEIRTNGDPNAFNNWQTRLLFPMGGGKTPRNPFEDSGGPPNYWQQGFLAVQALLAIALGSHCGESESESVVSLLRTVELHRVPFPAFRQDNFLEAAQVTLSTMVMMSFLYPCIATVKMITVEKERQLKEAMKIMGLGSSLHWLAWFIKSFLLFLISAIVITIILEVGIFEKGNSFVVFIFLVLYLISTICFCFMISVFFTKATTAAVVAGLAWFITMIPYSLLQQNYETTSLSTKLLVCLLANTGMAYGLQVLVAFEGTGEGSNFGNLMNPATQDDDLAVGAVMLMLVVDSVLYLLIALYVEAVFPGMYGVPKPWYFLFQKSFWVKTQPQSSAKESITFTNNGSFEEEPRDLKAGVQIRNLSKVFDKNKVAVDNLNLNMYEGQITVLLGHNGAGKTTTMSMLTGMYTPTSGTAIVGGYDICTDIDGVRDSLGLCPQHNVLFDELTVREHLYFFAKLKGLDGAELEAEIRKYIGLLQLEPKEHAQSQTLSGGMKRKLAAGVALCGKSKVVMFDEPTSGMDPAARRALWDLLQEEKAGRTLLLTTHFMDEADLLGDRIAIMAGGRLKCCGSSFFLKKRYGAGYRLIIAKGEDCDTGAVTTLLQRHISGLVHSQDLGSELSYQLDEEQSPKFETMFRELEGAAKELHVNSFGVSLTTMEEVFIQVGKDEETNVVDGVFKTNGHADRSSANTFSNGAVVEPSDNGGKSVTFQNGNNTLTGSKLLVNQMRASLMKKGLTVLRGWLLFIIQCLLPVVLIIISILMSRMWAFSSNLPARSISLSEYTDSHTLMAVDQTSDSQMKNLSENYRKLVESEGGFQDVNGGSSATQNLNKFILDQYENNLTKSRRSIIIGASFASNESEKILTAWFSDLPYHAMPLAFSMMANAILDTIDVGLSFVNYPLPFTEESQVLLLSTGANIGFQVAFNLGFSLSIVAAFFTMFPVRERISKAKHLQFVSGTNIVVYWGSHLIVDGLSFLLTSLLIVIVLACFQEGGYSSFEELGRFFLVLICFGWSMLPLMYLMSFWADSPSGGFTRMTMFNMVTGCILILIITTLKFPALGVGEGIKVADYIFAILPHYNLCHALINLYTNWAYLDTCSTLRTQCEAPSPCCKNNCGTNCIKYEDDFFSINQPGIGYNILMFIIVGCLLHVLLFLIEYRFFKSCQLSNRCKCCSKDKGGLVFRAPEPEDSDVLDEKTKIASRDTHELSTEYSVVLRDVTKYYGNFLAVDHISVGVKRGECFGLLGINGAGKTTTFKMMTGDEDISSGDGFLEGLSLKNNMKRVHQLIGYCPQFDALIEELTGRETLRLFCLLRGLPEHEVFHTTNRLADELLFAKHLDKQVKAYSGGNKRKLSTAVALIGEPPVVFLDEPTAGMDPVAKRHLWNVICKVRDSGTSIILTSHSMEECEALCTRLVIMVNGVFKCLGSLQHLKNKFAEGFTLIVKVKDSLSVISSDTRAVTISMGAATVYNVDPVKEFVERSFQGANLKEEYMGLLTYFIPPSNLTWSQMFGIMERSKQELNIEDYSFGQTSLEQVFLTFTKAQTGVQD